MRNAVLPLHAMPSIFSHAFAGGGDGTAVVTLATQPANTVWAVPGAGGEPEFLTLTPDHVPDLRDQFRLLLVAWAGVFGGPPAGLEAEYAEALASL
jgi:hypothetical protein